MPEYLIKVEYTIRIAAPDENVAFDRAGESLPFQSELKRMTNLTEEEG